MSPVSRALKKTYFIRMPNILPNWNDIHPVDNHDGLVHLGWTYKDGRGVVVPTLCNNRNPQFNLELPSTAVVTCKTCLESVVN